jgi:hypothetical protein
MTITFFFSTFYSRNDINNLSTDEFKMIYYHEQHHRKHWWRPRSCHDEYEAELYAVKMMLNEGYSIDSIMKMVIDYRMLSKFGLRLNDFETKVRGELNV